MLERTLGIIKPDAVAKRAIGEILSRAERAGLRLIGARMLRLSTRDAERFYAVHKERPFFRSLVRFMTEGPVLVFVLEGEGAVERWRALIGPTDSAQAPPNTIRHDFGSDVERNAVHGSDGPETARWEIGFFFSERELVS